MFAFYIKNIYLRIKSWGEQNRFLFAFFLALLLFVWGFKFFVPNIVKINFYKKEVADLPFLEKEILFFKQKVDQTYRKYINLEELVFKSKNINLINYEKVFIEENLNINGVKKSFELEGIFKDFFKFFVQLEKAENIRELNVELKKVGSGILKCYLDILEDL